MAHVGAALRRPPKGKICWRINLLLYVGWCVLSAHKCGASTHFSSEEQRLQPCCGRWARAQIFVRDSSILGSFYCLDFPVDDIDFNRALLAPLKLKIRSLFRRGGSNARGGRAAHRHGLLVVGNTKLGFEAMTSTV
jgi:hypothetical protein